MTDRVHSLTVVLDENMRIDDVQRVVEAIQMVRGVLIVGENVADSASYVAEKRALMRLKERVYSALFEEGA